MVYFDYTKEKDFLICIDSDGCAMDTMNSKHFNSFGPEFVKSYDLEEYKEEYKEPIKLTQFEYEYLKFAKENEYNFIARDKNNNLYLYSNKPWKDEIDCDCEDRTTPVFAELFKFVKWEDKEPWNIDNILANCEVMQDE